MLVLILALAIGIFACGPAGSTASEPAARDLDPPSIDIVVDLQKIENGRFPVSITYTGLNSRRSIVVEPGRNDEYRYHETRFTDASGNEIPFTRRKHQYRLQQTGDSSLTVSYLAQPGGLGRHGLQGVVSDDFVVFDGRLFLQHVDSRRLRSARIKFIRPDGWTVASPFRRDGDWYYMDYFEPSATKSVVADSCMAVGRFDIATRRFGEMEARVATFADWSDEHKKALVDKTFKIQEYFQETLGFELSGPHAVVWTPKHDRKKVFGGSNANGTCFEHPRDTLLNWRLLGHRIGHAMNKYTPSGMKTRLRRDRWFEEGWASYVEITSTVAAGVAEDDSYWNPLYNSYKLGRRRGADRDMPLGDEPDAEGMTKEYVHYRKGPLVVRMLDYLVEARSDRTMEQFIRAMWQKHGSQKSYFPVQEELEAFTGASFEDFWTMMVDQEGFVIPVWDTFLTPEMREALQRPAAATVGRSKLSGEYLHFLASSGYFETYAEIAEFLVAEERRRRQLAEQEIDLYPDLIRRHLYAIPGEDRYAIARLEGTHPLPQSAATDDGLELNLDRKQEDGRIFAELLALERQYESAVTRGPLSRIVVRAEEKSLPGSGETRLAFSRNAAVLLGTEWRGAVPSYEMAIGADAVVASRLPGRARGADQGWLAVEPERRPEGDTIVKVTVEADGKTLATRAFWQRGEEIIRRKLTPRQREAIRKRNEQQSRDSNRR